MTQWSEVHLPCPCGKSSDAYCVHKDGHRFCFSCNKSFGDRNINEIDYSFEYLPTRGITRETMEFFGVLTKVDKDDKPVSVGFPYYITGEEEPAYKVRFLADKQFHSTGPMANANLFGKNKFPIGSARAITITEGEFDAMPALS